jgi:hypothetical protein
MAATSIEELRRAISRFRRRRHLILLAKHTGWALVAAATLFILSGVLAMALDPTPPVRFGCFTLVVAGTAGIAWAAWRSVRRSMADERQLAHYVDEHLPDLQQRLVTSMDTLDKVSFQAPSRLAEALWQDTVARVRPLNIERVADPRPAWYAFGIAALLLALLAVALIESARFSTVARQIAWPWSVSAGRMAAAAAFEVEPGDILIRRGSDVTVRARFKKAAPQKVTLNVRQGSSQWRPVAMQIGSAPEETEYLLSEVTADTRYYVASAAGKSAAFHIQVFDLTRMDRIDVHYRYPPHTGLKNKTEENAGDIVAPAGTRVSLEIGFNDTVEKGLLKFNDGSRIDLDLEGRTATAAFEVTKDGTYIVDAVDREGRKIENPGEYLIRAVPDLPPELTLNAPGGDKKVMALEEVTIEAAATDDFGLTHFALRYSVAGGQENSMSFMTGAQQPAPASLEGKAVIYLEDLQVAPGDFISYYLTAADNSSAGTRAEVMSDIYFLEVIRTDEEFRRASGPGGGGGGGQGGQNRSPSALVQTQKNIIAATWKLLNRQATMPAERFAEEVRIVAESQQNIAQRAKMSLSRLSERFSFADESFDQAVVHLFEAVTHMQKAAENLFAQDLKEALGPEQAALQAILKAEAESRRTAIQMARNRGSGSGQADQSQEREDLRRLFEMEMGRLENRYEMPASAAAAENAGQNDLLNKLRELARRQERLSRAQEDAARRKDRMSEAERKRRLEELRREQEALQREAEALARNGSPADQSAGGRSSMRSLDQAIDQMRRAARDLQRGEGSTAAASGRRALEQLREQEKQVQRRHTASVDELARSLGRKGEQLQSREDRILEQMQALRSGEDGAGKEAASRDERETVSDVIADKDRLLKDLKEARETIWAIGDRGRQSHPELARRALETLRELESERIGRRIEESKADLQKGRTALAAENEKGIQQSIERLAGRLKHFNLQDPQPGPQRIAQAAENAAALLAELEDLQRQTESMQSAENGSNPSPSARQLSSRGAASGQPQQWQRMRDDFERSRSRAQGLAQPWAQGQGWSAAARSIHRELSSRRIEDFLGQPDLWQRLVEPARELAAALAAQAEIDRVEDSPLAVAQQKPPERYKSLVETYYRNLSETTAKPN